MLKFWLRLFPIILWFADDNGSGDFDSLLNADGEDEPTSDEGDKDDKSKKPVQKTLKPEEVEERFKKLENSYKNLQELSRQKDETIKELSNFKERLMGVDESKKDEVIEKELENLFEEKPIEVIRQLVKEAIEPVSQDFQKKQIESKVHEVIKEIDKEYEVDWDKHWNKILSKAEYFSDKAKKEMPKEVLMQAARMAGVLKERKKDEPIDYIEGAGSIQMSPNVLTRNEKMIKDIKDRIMAKKPKNILPK